MGRTTLLLLLLALVALSKSFWTRVPPMLKSNIQSYDLFARHQGWAVHFAGGTWLHAASPRATKVEIDATTGSSTTTPSSSSSSSSSSMVEASSSSSASLGRPHTESSRAKISAKNKGKVPWNVGKSHSEETRQRIALKTREAMMRRKLEKLAALGMTLQDYDDDRIKRKRERKQAERTGLTAEGRKRISESVKKRWDDPEYRVKYTLANRGARNHSEATRAKISEAITEKWKDTEYREKVKRNPTPEERAKISATLKLRWQEPEFRDKMLNHTFQRTDEWRNLVSERIREKWLDPTYRESVTSAIRASNKTVRASGGGGAGTKVRTLRPSRPSAPRRPRQSPEEAKARKRAARQAIKEKNQARKEAFKAAKETAQKSGGATRLKELLGRELWFEEKMKRRGKGDTMLDDDTLEKQLTAEWSEDDDDDDDDDGKDGLDDDDDDDDYGDEGDEDEYYDDDGPLSTDIIEVYDEEGNLVGEYTDEEFEALRKSKPS